MLGAKESGDHSLKSEFILTQNLRFVPKDPKALENYIAELTQKVKDTHDISEQVSLQEEIGVYLRSLDLFDEAADLLQEVLLKIKKNNLLSYTLLSSTLGKMSSIRVDILQHLTFLRRLYQLDYEIWLPQIKSSQLGRLLREVKK